jgi:hypothetical protein
VRVAWERVSLRHGRSESIVAVDPEQRMELLGRIADADVYGVLELLAGQADAPTQPSGGATTQSTDGLPPE